MTEVVIALPAPDGHALASELHEVGVRVRAVCAPDQLDEAILSGTDAVVLPASRRALDPTLVATCDRARTRIITVGGDDPRLPARLGLAPPLPPSASASQVLAAARDPFPRVAAASGASARIIAAWGPPGAPGRTSVAIELAAALARGGRSAALLDADTHAPSVALLLGLGTDSPGLAAACRRAASGSLDTAELSRLSLPVACEPGSFEVLSGLNRASRWPELSASRLRTTLSICREWSDTVIVDVASSLEADEELSFDVDTPRRNAATLTVLAEADEIVAVTSAEPLGIARLLQDHAELRAITGATPVTVVVNRIRSGAVGFDARGQIRRTLERFAGIERVLFVPDDPRAADAARLKSVPVARVAPKSPVVAAISALAQSLAPAVAPL